jgi:hypothetical protein
MPCSSGESVPPGRRVPYPTTRRAEKEASGQGLSPVPPFPTDDGRYQGKRGANPASVGLYEARFSKPIRIVRSGKLASCTQCDPRRQSPQLLRAICQAECRHSGQSQLYAMLNTISGQLEPKPPETCRNQAERPRLTVKIRRDPGCTPDLADSRRRKRVARLPGVDEYEGRISHSCATYPLDAGIDGSSVIAFTPTIRRAHEGEAVAL